MTVGCSVRSSTPSPAVTIVSVTPLAAAKLASVTGAASARVRARIEPPWLTSGGFCDTTSGTSASLDSRRIQLFGYESAQPAFSSRNSTRFPAVVVDGPEVVVVALSAEAFSGESTIELPAQNATAAATAAPTTAPPIFTDFVAIARS